MFKRVGALALLLSAAAVFAPTVASAQEGYDGRYAAKGYYQDRGYDRDYDRGRDRHQWREREWREHERREWRERQEREWREHQRREWREHEWRYRGY